MSISYWISKNIYKEPNPVPKSLADCIHYSWNYEVPSKVSIKLKIDEEVSPEHGPYIFLKADFKFEFTKWPVECEKDLAFFGVPLFFKGFARSRIKKANNKLTEIISEIERSGVKTIEGKDQRYSIGRFPYLLYNGETLDTDKHKI